MIIKQSKFLISVGKVMDGLPEGKLEIAVAGKSNVGKSSFINFLTNNSKLARTSKEPGRTRLINYFDINEGDFYLVDLPGYGYAGVSKEMKKGWGEEMQSYLLYSHNLANVFCLLDIRHEPTVQDKQLITFLQHYSIPFTLIATKSDKLSKAQIARQVPILAAACKVGVGNVYVTSSQDKTGKDAILERIQQIIDNFTPLEESVEVVDDVSDGDTEE